MNIDGVSSTSKLENIKIIHGEKKKKNYNIGEGRTYGRS